MLILDDDGQSGLEDGHESGRIAGGIQREVGDKVCTCKVLPQLIPGRRKEGKYDESVRILMSDGLQYGTPLLKFTDGCAMHPDTFPWCILHARFQSLKQLFPAIYPRACLWIPDRGDQYQESVCLNQKIIDKSHGRGMLMNVVKVTPSPRLP